MIDPWKVVAAGMLLQWSLVPRLLSLRAKSPGATLAWLWALLLLPGIGAILFLLIGSEKMQRRRLAMVSALTQELAGTGVAAHSDAAAIGLPELEAVTGFAPTGGNAVDVLSEGTNFFPVMLATIAEARQHLHVLFYHWEDDRAGGAVLDALVAAAQRGVKVRLLLDEIGSISVRRSHFARLLAAGGEFSWFSTFAPLRGRFHLNLRNHRKLLVADGEIALIGGMNVADTYWFGGERPFTAALDQVGVYIYTKDCDGRYLFVNEHVRQVFGLPYEQIIGRDDSHFFDFSKSDELRINDRRVITEGCTLAQEERNIHAATGEERIYWTVKSPVRNEAGQIVGLCGISTDITARKRMEEELPVAASGDFETAKNVALKAVAELRSSPYNDFALRLRGPVTVQLNEVFAQDWYFATDRELTDRALYPDVGPVGDVHVQIVPGAPDTELDEMQLAKVALLHRAQHTIRLMSPYFVPDAPLLTALQLAALRGVDVAILVPAQCDHFYLTHVMRSYYLDLLPYGVRILEFHPRMLHAKSITVDGRYLMTGSANLDVRSLRLNFELNVLLDSPAATQQVDALFAQGATAATEVTVEAHARRPLRHKLAEAVFRPAAGLL